MNSTFISNLISLAKDTAIGTLIYVKERKVERKLLFCRCRNQFRVDRGGSASDQRPIAFCIFWIHYYSDSLVLLAV